MSRALLAASALILVACGGSAEDRARERASWAATAGMVTRGWVAGALPDRYAQDTLREAARHLFPARPAPEERP